MSDLRRSSVAESDHGITLIKPTAQSSDHHVQTGVAIVLLTLKIHTTDLCKEYYSQLLTFHIKIQNSPCDCFLLVLP
jgi:hypothetical protein